jgi:membrane complex biogenesis BtpA family protein
MSTHISIKKIFKKDKNIVIGALHFPPLLGFDDFPGFKVALKNALIDLKVFEDGGVDGIFLENNYGLSKEKIDSSVVVAMSYLIGEIRKRTKLPLGASVLWNDYQAALALAKTHDLQFIRVPVFVDTVKPYCGEIKAAAKKVVAERKHLSADNVAIFADIHVKHAKLLSKMNITASAKKAIKEGADALIMTGSWTGVKPDVSEMQKVRKVVADFPILVGSGADMDNVQDLLVPATGVIVSTSLKKGITKKGERNVKGYEQRVDLKKTKGFVETARGIGDRVN